MPERLRLLVPLSSGLYFRMTDFIRASKSAFCMAPVWAVGLPLMGMKRKVGMLCMPNVSASSRSLSMFTL